jgi:Domain of unknown function (DUF4340)
MRGKQLAIVLLLLVALGGIALLLHSRNTASWSNTATTTSGKVLNFPLNEVAQVTIKGGGTEVNLLKKDDVWRVKERFDYPADFTKVASLIRRLWELRPVQDVDVGPSQLTRFQLTEPDSAPSSSVLIDLKANDEKRLAALLLGKKHLRESGQAFASGGSVPVGRYVAPQDGSKPVFLISEMFDDAQTKPEQWLNRDFVKIEKSKLIAVAAPNPGTNWRLIRDSDSAPWKFADPKRGEELDNAKASSLAALLTNMSFVDLLDPKTPPEQSGLDKPSTARIETFDNFAYELRVGKLMGDNYPVLISVTAELPKERTPGKDEKPEDKEKLDQQFQATQKPLAEKLDKEKKLENRPYLIPKATVEQLIKDRATFMAEKKAAASPAPAAPSPGTPKRKPR